VAELVRFREQGGGYAMQGFAVARKSWLYPHFPVKVGPVREPLRSFDLLDYLSIVGWWLELRTMQDTYQFLERRRVV
jgi:hypothetical protein